MGLSTPPKVITNGNYDSADGQLRLHFETGMAMFLKCLSQGMQTAQAAQISGVRKDWLYYEKRDNEEFGQLWEEAVDYSTAVMEKTAYDRAVTGWDEPVFQGGQEVGSVRKFSDHLLEFMLKARKPEVYRERLDPSLRDQQVLNIFINPGENPVQMVAAGQPSQIAAPVVEGEVIHRGND